MSNCPVVDIANELVTNLRAESLSKTITVRASLGDLPHKAEDDTDLMTTNPLVDIVLPMQPTIELGDRAFAKLHSINVTIGLRQKLGDGAMTRDGMIDLAAVTPLFNLFYELIALFMPSSTYPTGQYVETSTWSAVFTGPVEIMKLWDDQLLTAAPGLYCGAFRVPLQIKESGS